VRHVLIEPGFWSSPQVGNALLVGIFVAIIVSTVGLFTVVRGQAFAGEALGDVGASGGSSSYLVGINSLWGFVAVSVLAAAAMELVGIQRVRGRDLATGIVLGVGFSLTALFLYIGTTFDNVTGAPVTILFGSIFAISPTIIPLVLILGSTVLAILLLIHKPLLLMSLSTDLARVRGIRVRVLGFIYLLAMGLAVALSAVTIGAILSTALLIGPAASAVSIAKSPRTAILWSLGLAIFAIVGGIILSFDSYYWPPHHQGWPASFFIVFIIVSEYVIAVLVRKFIRR
jgi:zinc/manganese transport system permease protein